MARQPVTVHHHVEVEVQAIGRVTDCRQVTRSRNDSPAAAPSVRAVVGAGEAAVLGEDVVTASVPMGVLRLTSQVPPGWRLS